MIREGIKSDLTLYTSVNLVTINNSGNKVTETVVIHIVNMNPDVEVIDDSGEVVTTASYSINSGDIFELPQITAYSYNNYSLYYFVKDYL